ncbi:MAG: hypothetical protein U5J95_08110 [Balneolaceae bacterium]|nr:hypothetical protein [Balneolaceae bacterium]
MKSFKIVLKNGVTETIEAADIDLNQVLDQVEVKDEDGKVMEDYYFKIEHISAIIPQ